MEADFPGLSRQASAFLDYYTQGRAGKAPCRVQLAMACCAVAEALQLEAQSRQVALAALEAGLDADGAAIQQETAGSYSRTLLSGTARALEALRLASTARKGLQEAADRYLVGTGLLYRGGARP